MGIFLMDLDSWISKIKDAHHLSEDELQLLCEYWLVAHPEYLKNDLYIGGDSYGGMYATLVLEQVYNGNEIMGELPLNIKGYILGNPHADKFLDFNGRIDYARHMGLLSNELYESAKSNCGGNYLSNIAGNKLCDHDMQRISECLDNICMPHILDKCCDVWSDKLAFPSSLGRDQLLSLGPLKEGWCQAHNFTYSYLWGNDEAVQEALNVRKGTIKEWSRCRANLVYRIVGMERTEVYTFDVQSVIPIHLNLTSKNTRALIYSGDHDMAVPRTVTLDWIVSLGLPVKSAWGPWYLDGETAGYKVLYSHKDYELTYATIKGGGHLPSEEKTRETFAMMSRWFAGEPM